MGKLQKNKGRKNTMRTRSGRGMQSEWIFGRRPVLEVLRAQRRKLQRALMFEGSLKHSEDLRLIKTLLEEQGVVLGFTERAELDLLCDGGNHQGIAVLSDPFVYHEWGDILERVTQQDNALVMVLDHIEDPQNVGSLLRSADAAGVTAVVIPEKRAADISAAVTRASSGATEHVPIVRVVNITRAVQELKEAGAWITGMALAPESQLYTTIDFKGRIGIVIGSEGRGISRLVQENCDFTAYIPMLGKVDSLNAGVAGAVVLYEVVRQRNNKIT